VGGIDSSKGKPMIYLWVVLGVVAAFVVFSLGWRWASRIWSLPCPSLTAWRFDNPLIRGLTRTTLDRLGLRPGQRILEIGPGPGRLLIPAAQRVLPGVTVHEKNRELAQLRAA
jgi:Mycolic acid cyclopropane synthetase